MSNANHTSLFIFYLKLFANKAVCFYINYVFKNSPIGNAFPVSNGVTTVLLLIFKTLFYLLDTALRKQINKNK